TEPSRIDDELAYANQLFQQLGINVIDVSKRSIEESSMLIEEFYKNNAYAH
ncbi:phosphoenolpyruvate synthase regulatory protein, partial [Escherichia coli]